MCMSLFFCSLHKHDLCNDRFLFFFVFLHVETERNMVRLSSLSQSMERLWLYFFYVRYFECVCLLSVPCGALIKNTRHSSRINIILLQLLHSYPDIFIKKKKLFSHYIQGIKLLGSIQNNFSLIYKASSKISCKSFYAQWTVKSCVSNLIYKCP